MKICYMDESGDVGALPSPTSPIQPVLIIAALIIDHADLPMITEEFITLKRELYPTIRRREYISSILPEIKGSEVRKNVCSIERQEQRHAIRFLDGVMKILDVHDVKIIGRSWIKGVGQNFNGRAVYTYSVQYLFASFQRYLEGVDDIGVLTADSRSHSLDRNVSHSIFTQKFKRTGDVFSRIIDLPMFAISDNHAGIQLCDILCSSLLAPLSIHSYCTGYVRNLHVRPGYQRIKDRYAAQLKALQFRYRDDDGRWRGGITVSDALAQRSGGLLFR